MFFPRHYFEHVVHVTNSDFFGISSAGWAAISAIGTLLAVVAALFGDQIRNFLFKPRLVFSSALPIPQKQLVTIMHGKDKIERELEYTMYRLLIKNIGFAPAANVRALIIAKDNSPLPLPVPLTWTHHDVDARDISRFEPAYLDILQELGENFLFYSQRDKLINLPEYKLSNDSLTVLEIAFYESNRTLQSVLLKLDPRNKTLVVVGRS